MKKSMMVLALALCSSFAAAQVSPVQISPVQVTADLSRVSRDCPVWQVALGQTDGQATIEAAPTDRILGLSVVPGTKVALMLLCTTPNGTGRAAWVGTVDHRTHLIIGGMGQWTAFAGDVPGVDVR